MSIVVTLLARGAAEDITDDDKASIAAAFASAAGVEPSAVSVTIVPASVRIIADIAYASAASRDARKRVVRTGPAAARSSRRGAAW